MRRGIWTFLGRISTPFLLYRPSGGVRAREGRMSKKGKKKMRARREYGWCESVYRFIARFISLSCIPTPFWSPVLAVETQAGVRTLIGKPGVVSSTRLGKSARLPSALCLLPSDGFLLTPPLKQIKAPSPSRAHLRSSR